MMNDAQFLEVLKQSFIVYLKTDPRSNEKLKILHGAISKDIKEKLHESRYAVASLGFEAGKEKKINGRYVEKNVDITILEEKKPVAGVAVKYVMSNYSQNSNNYFENMLGETANIRSAQIPYYQIFIIPDQIPYFDKEKTISKWEKITEHNIQKYIKLSNDDTDLYFHTPNKTLVFIVHIENSQVEKIRNKKEYESFYLNNTFQMKKSSLSFDFGKNIIFNDYEKFIEKITYAIKGL